MTSTWLLLTIFGIWALMVMPMWINDRRRESATQMHDFRTAMETLGDGALLPDRIPGMQVAAKRAPRTGSGNRLRKKLLKQRRQAFFAALATWPLSLVLQVTGLTPATIWVLPPLSFVTFVIFARYTIRKARRARNFQLSLGRATASIEQPIVERVAEPQPRRETTAPAVQPRSSIRPVRNKSRLTFAEGLAAIQRSAMRKLTATEPELKTHETPAWQPAAEAVATDEWIARPWATPETVLPAYVNAPAATTVPRELDRQHGAWGGPEMVAAARAQQDLADFVSEIVESAPAGQQILKDADDTGELFRILGA